MYLYSLKLQQANGILCAINGNFSVPTRPSFHYCNYRCDQNQLYVFADDFVRRWLTVALHIDFDTMAGADKFGDLYFVRLPQDVSDEIEEDPTGGKIKWEQGKLNGAPNKVEEIVLFHVGDVVTCLQKAYLIPGGGECVIYGTIMGSLGALLAFTSCDDVDFFSHLEMYMRQEHPPLCGSDHIAYRSAYFPVKDMIDGDLCEQFPTLPLDLQSKIADELDRTPGEILKKLEEAYNKIIGGWTYCEGHLYYVLAKVVIMGLSCFFNIG